MKTVSLALTPEEAGKETGEAMEMEKPKWPWGTCIYLDETAMAKLGVGQMPSGTILKIAGAVRVVGFSEREYEGGAHKTLDLQITDLGFAAGEEKPLAEKMYGDKAKA